MEDRTGTTTGRRHRRFRAVGAIVGAIGLLVTMSAPTHASNNVGTGDLTGTVTYHEGYELPPVLRVCESTSFDINLSSVAFVFNTVISGYAGPVTIEGSGSSTCESTTLGGGTVSFSKFEGVNPVTESELSCTDLVGGYTRTLTDMTMIMSGDCTVNRFGTGTVNFIAKLQFAPSGADGEGVTDPVSAAEVSGPFTLSPGS